MKSAIGAEFKKLWGQLDTVEKWVADNEGRARSRNLRIYGLDKGKVTDDYTLPDLIKMVFVDGFKIEEERATEIFAALDTYHWTNDNALILAFTRRIDLRFVKSLRKNLAEFKPHTNLLSVKDDLEPGQLAIEKQCRLKFKNLKSSNPTKTYKIVSYNRIACDQVVKVFSDW